MLCVELVYRCHSHIVALISIVLFEKQEVAQAFKNHRWFGLLQSLNVFSHGISIEPNEVLVFACDKEYRRRDFLDLLVIEFLTPLAPSCIA